MYPTEKGASGPLLPGHRAWVTPAAGVDPLAGHDCAAVGECPAEVCGAACGACPDGESVFVEFVDVVEGVALHALLPDEAEVAGLLALMLLTDARRDARTDPGDRLIVLPEQDRSRWDQRMIAEGRRLIDDAWQQERVGQYQLQAAIASTHAQATSAQATDWPQIAALYLWLERLQPTAPVRLARVVAVAEAFGPQRGLALLDQLDREHHLTDDPLVTQRAHAVRAHLFERLGDHDRAADHYRISAGLTDNAAERRYFSNGSGDRVKP